MTPIPVTLTTAGILGLIYVFLSARVSMVRNKTKTMMGEGTDPELKSAIRAHGNFQEFVPLALILLGGIEISGGSHTLLLILAILLVIARIAHPIGIAQPSPNAARAAGALLSYLVIGVAGIEALIRAL